MIHYTIAAVLFGIVLRSSVSLNSYSGQGRGPMYGDYEAQRHWMEITYNLPIDEWYRNTSDNDLLYWGLDYPPLTAYHSFICGWIAHKINPSWVALKESRGYESYEHKVFMRYTALVADLLIYIPAVVYFMHKLFGDASPVKKGMAIAACLAYPGLILIDHGHFQYNCVSLGFALWAVVFLKERHHLLGSIAFVLALNYKQMELYHAFPFFFFLLGVCWSEKTWFRKIVKLASIGITVIVTFVLCWFPFLRSFELASQVLKRLFPFGRGLYEDKVANVWCSIAVLVKLKNIVNIDHLVVLCALTTLLACIPTSLHLLWRPSFRNLVLSLINCSLAFFLFSFQVHEKSILIPALPVLLCLPFSPFASSWFLLISSFSMFPLLERDGQTISYFALNVIFGITVHQTFDVFGSVKKLWKTMFWLSVTMGSLLHVAKMTIQPPSKLPDLFPVLFSMFSCGHFVAFLLYYNYVQFSGKLQFMSNSSRKDSNKKGN